jgi:hypothetical protein
VAVGKTGARKRARRRKKQRQRRRKCKAEGRLESVFEALQRHERIVSKVLLRGREESTDGESLVRGAAVVLYASHHGLEMDQTLSRIAEDPGAVDELIDCTKSALAEVVNLTEADDPEVREAARWTLDALGFTPQGLGLVRRPPGEPREERGVETLGEAAHAVWAPFLAPVSAVEPPG